MSHTVHPYSHRTGIIARLEESLVWRGSEISRQFLKCDIINSRIFRRKSSSLLCKLQSNSKEAQRHGELSSRLLDQVLSLAEVERGLKNFEMILLNN